MLALSPDGKRLAFLARSPSGRSQLHVRELDGWESRPLSGTEGAIAPFFSPNGQWLAFFAGGALKKVSATGGASVTIVDVQAFRGGTWGPDETIVYAELGAGLQRVSASGGTPVQLTTLREGESSHRWPWFLPNGRAVLFVALLQAQVFDEGAIEAVLLDTGERKVVRQSGTSPRHVSSSHLLYAREETLFAMPWDAERIEPTGEPSPVVENVRIDAFGHALYSVAADGTLVYLPSLGGRNLAKLVWVDREGNATALTQTLGDYESPRLSPDGQRLIVRKTGEGGQQDVWLFELSRGTLTRLTFEEGLRPLWSPDGRTVFFSSARTGSYNIFSKPADGSGSAEQLTDGPFRVPASITSDGKTLVFRHGGDAGFPKLDVGMMNLEGGGEPGCSSNRRSMSTRRSSRPMTGGSPMSPMSLAETRSM